MNDPDVGELWRRAKEYTNSHAGLSWAHNVLSLIRKLVAESINAAFGYTPPHHRFYEPRLRVILDRYGIDPEEFNQ